jgi:hypothetical protein
MGTNVTLAGTSLIGARSTGRIPAADAPLLGDLVRPVAAQPRYARRI